MRRISLSKSLIFKFVTVRYKRKPASSQNTRFLYARFSAFVRWCSIAAGNLCISKYETGITLKPDAHLRFGLFSVSDQRSRHEIVC